MQGDASQLKCAVFVVHLEMHRCTTSFQLDSLPKMRTILKNAFDIVLFTYHG